MTVAYHPAAQDELRRATLRYERARAGVGQAFLTTVRETEGLLTERPALGIALGGANRRVRVRSFPYPLIYRFEHERLYILAVAHMRRHPEYWLHRE